MSGIESAESEYHDDGEAGRIGAGFRLSASGFTGEPTLGLEKLARRQRRGGPVHLTEVDAFVE